MTIRAAKPGDIDLVHRELMHVIATSEYYNDTFKAHEMRRLSKSYLRNLMAFDPWHVMVLTTDGKPCGAAVSGPEYGAIFRYWTWIFSEYQDSKLGMTGMTKMRQFDEHWDNGRFHKAFTFVRPENDLARKLLRRYGYREVCLLEKHLFGQDYLLIEKPYTKVTDGYDSGVGMGRLGRLLARLASLLGR